ncbi:hypothetical protein [Fibrella arboris]|uniref:hypothetical protein n=1 Tax=Fibrella arboris TaxID=3242486 RepID=UPI00351FDE56
MTEDEMQALRNDIKKKYESYHADKPGKYPKIKFNSYPAAYLPLQDSFKEELQKYGQLDGPQIAATIPSTRIFAKIFHENYILREAKIIDTCYLYARGKTRDYFAPVATDEDKAPIHQSMNSSATRLSFTNWPLTRWPVVAGITLLSGVVVYALVGQSQTKLPASDLVITRPIHNNVVPRQLFAEGRVSNASHVWVVVRNSKAIRYWVQPEINVNADGSWKGPIFVGSEDKADIGFRAQIRAFVKPMEPIKEGDVLYAWPKAEASSGMIEVIRGPQDHY